MLSTLFYYDRTKACRRASHTVVVCIPVKAVSQSTLIESTFRSVRCKLSLVCIGAVCRAVGEFKSPESFLLDQTLAAGVAVALGCQSSRFPLLCFGLFLRLKRVTTTERGVEGRTGEPVSMKQSRRKVYAPRDHPWHEKKNKCRVPGRGNGTI